MRMKISRRSVRSYTHREGKVSARSASRNIPRETPRDRAGKTGRSGTLHMSRGRCYPDVGAWSDPRKNAGRIVGVREIRVEERSDRHTRREKKREREREKSG